MRWPIHFQLLSAILVVVLAALLIASATGSYFGSQQAQRQRDEDLRRVTNTLTQAHFPLTDSVLRQARGLSGAEFVLLDADGQVVASTLALEAPEAEVIRSLPMQSELESLAASPTVEIDQHKYLCRRVSMERRLLRGEQGNLAVLYRQDHWQEVARQAAYPALIAGAGAAVLALVVASLLAGRLVGPLKQLGEQASLIADGTFRGVKVPPRNDEIRDLALSINHMAERLKVYEAEVRRHERLAALGQLGAGLAHQLRNSATGARIDIELHRRECASPGGDTPPLSVALQQLRLMETYLQRLLDIGSPTTMAQSPPNQCESVALGELLAEAEQLVAPAMAHHGVTLHRDVGPERLVVRGERESLHETIVNLLLNALEAARTAEGETPTVAAELFQADARHAAIRIMDTGPGPSPEIAPRLFEPFVTEKPDGTGLGLFVARQIVESHGGSIDWARKNGMTQFTVTLPLKESEGEGVI